MEGYERNQAKDNTTIDSESKLKLEEILNQNISLDTDVMDFFTIAGWYYRYRGSLYKNATYELRNTLREYVEIRRRGMDRKTKAKEMKFVHSVSCEYVAGEIKTLRDLKQTLEEKGMLRGMGYIGLAEFNKTIKEHGLAPFKAKYLGPKRLKQIGYRNN